MEEYYTENIERNIMKLMIQDKDIIEEVCVDFFEMIINDKHCARDNDEIDEKMIDISCSEKISIEFIDKHPDPKSI